jgi:hypothetical protein
MTEVEMLYTEGCPHAAEYLPHLRQLLGDVGIDEAVRTRLVTSDAQAHQARFLGSPTIRVNGRDVEPRADERQDFGLTCRLYDHPDGRRGSPPDDWVLSVLRQQH